MNEKRVSKRYEQKASVTCCYINCPDPCGGELINYSKSGMCFETIGLFREKTTVLVRSHPDSWGTIDPETLEGLRTVSIAEVKWCNEFADDENPHYEIGVQYY